MLNQRLHCEAAAGSLRVIGTAFVSRLRVLSLFVSRCGISVRVALTDGSVRVTATFVWPVSRPYSAVASQR